MLAVLDRLPRDRFKVSALAPSSGMLSHELRKRAVNVVPFDLRDATGSRLPADVVRQRLIQAIHDVSPDVVHANSLAMGRLVGSIANKIDAPSIAHLRDIIGLSAAAVRDLNRNTVLIAVSHAACDFHVGQGVEAERVRVLYNGVDGADFQPRPTTGRLRRELNLDDDAFLIATIGQIGLRKGLNVLAAAAVEIAAKVKSNSLHFLLVGERFSTKAESVDFDDQLTRTFESAGLGDHLHRLGFREDVAGLMNECDLLAHPAHQEPLGRVLLEAGAAGLPIVATSVGGTPEVLTDGVHAQLTPPNAPESLSAAILEMFENAPLRNRMANAARERIVSDFNIETAAAILVELWNNIRSTSPH